MEHFADIDFCILKIGVACFVAPGSGTPVHKNRVMHGIVYYPGGADCYEFSDGNKVNVSGRQIVYIPKHSSYTVYTVGKSEPQAGCFAINFDNAQELNIPGFSFTVRNPQKFEELFGKAEEIWRKKPGGYQMTCKALLYEIFVLAQKELSADYSPKSMKNRIRPAVNYIADHYTTSEIRISYLAEICGMSPEYFRKNFAKIYITSPLKYISGLKISRAKELLKLKMNSVSEIAVMCGFSEDCCFRREFKKATSMTPRQYRQGHGVK